MLKRLVQAVKDQRIKSLPSRIFLQEVVIKALGATGRRRLLSIGTRSYNTPMYRQCSEQGISVWSVDIDPRAARYGAPAGHFVGDVRELNKLVDGRLFDVIVLNGVLGYGLNNESDIIATIVAMRKIAERGAVLVVGWNPGRTDDAEIVALRAALKRAPLQGVPDQIEFPSRGKLQTEPHRYEFFSFD